MKKTIILLVIAFLAIGLLSAEEDCKGFRGEGHGKGSENHGKGHDGTMMHEKIAEELDLTDDQKTEMRKFQTDNKKMLIQKKSDMKILKIEVYEALAEQKFAEAKRITEKISNIEKEIAVNKIEMHEKRWEILTDEQKEKAKKLMNEKPMMKKKMMQKHKKGNF